MLKYFGGESLCDIAEVAEGSEVTGWIPKVVLIWPGMKARWLNSKLESYVALPGTESQNCFSWAKLAIKTQKFEFHVTKIVELCVNGRS